MARMYGFSGDVTARRVQPLGPRSAYEQVNDSWRQKLREWNRGRRGHNSHLLWEFVTNK